MRRILPAPPAYKGGSTLVTEKNVYGGGITPSCPVPLTEYPHVLLAHGGGGTMSRMLIENIFVPAFGNDSPAALHDGAVLDLENNNIALTTDSFVVRPIFFPGGDIGTLAVNGTVNDLAMCGARPRFLSAGFVLEEGLLMESLWRVALSMGAAADAAGVRIITGDTKVVERGKGDQIYINTAGVGVIECAQSITPSRIRPGDVVIINGDIGRHGMAVLAKREGLHFESAITSDCAPLGDVVLDMVHAGIDIHCLRDLTRGGLAAAANEIAAAAGAHIILDERSIPVSNPVRAACEMLGLDPLHVANEGRFIAFIPKKDSDRVLEILHAHPVGINAAVMGTVTDNQGGLVTLRTLVGTQVILETQSGEQLPRIC
ncbi:MAG: hydrogenase expression/formation protein HypE [Candidatus Latescibacterota bacterium]|nr:MAG: hydrogenase expression/formation protein HypE [Candidatus Latescibacterota bacterium]